jgi:alpha-beta hydrolase superfamily lysophospholipase
MDGSQPTYQDVTHWRGYQQFYPESLRWDSANGPAEQWWRWRGIDVHLDRLPAPQASGTVILVHGAGGYGRMLAPYARMLASALPVEVVAPDLIGYGLSRTADRLVEYQEWIDCVGDLVSAEKARSGRPVFLVGASVGGMLAYSVAARGEVAGLIVTCLLDPRDVAVRMRMTRLPVMGRLAVPALRRLRRCDRVQLPVRWVANMGAMSNNAAVNDLIRADSCGGGNRISVKFLRTFMTSAPPVEPEQFTACPVLMTHPAADRWTPVELSLPFFDRVAADKRLVMLDEAGHLPIEEPGLTQMSDAVAAFLHRILRT